MTMTTTMGSVTGAGPVAVDVPADLYRGLGDRTRRALFTAAERLLERTGLEVALCPASA